MHIDYHTNTEDASPNQETLGNIALAIQNGFCPSLLIPVAPPTATGIAPTAAGKCPAVICGDGSWRALRAWQHGTSSAVREQCDLAGSNAGLLLGLQNSGQVFLAIDCDMAVGAEGDLSTQIAIEVKNIILRTIVRVVGRPVWARNTRLGRSAVLVRIPPEKAPGFKSVINLQHEVHGNLGKIELLAKNQQIVIAGQHPVTLRNAEWYMTDATDTLFRVPKVDSGIPTFADRAAVDALLDGVVRVLASAKVTATRTKSEASADKPSNGGQASAADRAPPSAALLLSTLKALPNPSWAGSDVYASVMHSVAGAIRSGKQLKIISVDQEREIIEEAAKWAARWDSATVSSAAVEEAKLRSDWLKRDVIYAGWPTLLNTAFNLGLTDIRNEEAAEVFSALDGPQTEEERAKSLKLCEEASVIGDPIGTMVRKFNKTNAVVNERGKTLIFTQRYDPMLNRKYWDRSTERDFVTLHKDVQLSWKNNDGKINEGSAGKIWMQNPDRRSYKEGVLFDPLNRDHPGWLNLWQGFAIEPKAGDWSLLRSHIQTIICCDEQEHFEYVLDWHARMFQRPDLPAETALVMRGREGIGKTLLMTVGLKIFGQHALMISQSRHLVGNFNAHLQDCVFLAADEAFFAGDKAGVGVLNSLLTADTLTIEGKGKNVADAKNCLHVIIASNNDWVVPAGKDSRRYVVFDPSAAQMQNPEYFKPLFAQLEAGGYAAFLHDMMARDISSFRPQAIPMTDGLKQQRLLSLSVRDKWFMNCLEEGAIGQQNTWDAWVSTDAIYNSYMEFARQTQERRPLDRSVLGKFLVEMGGSPKKTPADEVMGLVEKRTQGYVFKGLGETRKAFEKMLGFEVAWTDYAEPAESDPKLVNLNDRRQAA